MNLVCGPLFKVLIMSNVICYSVSSGQSASYKNMNISLPANGKLISIRVLNIPAWMQADNLKQFLNKLKPSQPLTLDFKELVLNACK